MHRPLYIGITTSYANGRINMSDNYLLAILEHGAVPVLLMRDSSPERIAFYRDAFDGFLFAGGVDIDPCYYGEEKKFDSVEIDSDRDRFEFALFQAIYETGKPILGICRGIQFINVALGGSLHQHIEGHNQSHFEGPPSQTDCPQEIRIAPNTLLSSIMLSPTAQVNTYHHQTINRVAPSLIVNATASDGQIEAVADRAHPFLLAVQWHPEIARREHTEHDTIFRAFLNACAVAEKSGK